MKYFTLVKCNRKLYLKNIEIRKSLKLQQRTFSIVLRHCATKHRKASGARFRGNIVPCRWQVTRFIFVTDRYKVRKYFYRPGENHWLAGYRKWSGTGRGTGSARSTAINQEGHAKLAALPTSIGTKLLPGARFYLSTELSSDG